MAIPWRSSGEDSVLSMPWARGTKILHAACKAAKKKKIKYNFTKHLQNKMQVKLEFVFSHIFVVHKIVKKLVNHICLHVTPHSDLEKSQTELPEFSHLLGPGRQRRRRGMDYPSVLLCPLPCACVLFTCKLSYQTIARTQRNRSSGPVGRRSVRQIG